MQAKLNNAIYYYTYQNKFVKYFCIKKSFFFIKNLRKTMIFIL